MSEKMGITLWMSVKKIKKKLQRAKILSLTSEFCGPVEWNWGVIIPGYLGCKVLWPLNGTVQENRKSYGRIITFWQDWSKKWQNVQYDCCDFLVPILMLTNSVHAFRINSCIK